MNIEHPTSNGEWQKTVLPEKEALNIIFLENINTTARKKLVFGC